MASLYVSFYLLKKSSIIKPMRDVYQKKKKKLFNESCNNPKKIFTSKLEVSQYTLQTTTTTITSPIPHKVV